MVEIVQDIVIRCECGKALDATFYDKYLHKYGKLCGKTETYLEVEACPTCLEDAKREVREEK